MSKALYPLVAVDVGNNRLKFGLFDQPSENGLPEPAAVHVSDGNSSLEALADWLDYRLPPGGRWWIGSVNRPGTTRLLQWLQKARPKDQITLLAAGDLPLVVALKRPDMVGIDRLLDAVAANRLRCAAASAVLVDVGTAITVDLVAADGSFQGGAILPGIALSARAAQLHRSVAAGRRAGAFHAAAGLGHFDRSGPAVRTFLGSRGRDPAVAGSPARSLRRSFGRLPHRRCRPDRGRSFGRCRPACP